MTGAWRSSDSSETTSSTLGGTLRPTMAHGGDHLSQLSFQLTSHKLTRKNYLEWAQSVKLAIDGRGKLGRLTEDVRQPAAGHPSLSAWRSENSLIIAWLINSMEPTIGKPYLFLPTSKDVWEAVRETYSDVENFSQIFDLKTKLWKSKREEREVTVYYNEIVSLWQELDQCYNDEWDCPSDSVKVMKKEECNRRISIVILMRFDLGFLEKNFASLREAFSEIKREETRQKVMLTNLNPKPAVDVENSALVVKGNEYDNDKKKRPWRDHCKKSWHTRETCWKIQGKPPNRKKKNGSNNRAFQVSNEGSQGQQRNKKIKIADGSLSTIAGTGSIVLSPSITLHNVLHVPKLSCNLLSISKLTNDLKYQANFYSTRCEFQEMVSGRMIGSARASDGLYFFEDGTNSGKHVQISPENITMANGPNFLINTELSGLNNENLDPKSIGLSHDTDGNKNEGSTGTKELLVYSRRKQIQRNETDASQYCQDSVPQTIWNSIEATDDTHTNPIHLNLPSSKSSQSESSMSNLDKPIAHRKGIRNVEIPKTVQDALQVLEWKEAILEEMRALEKNGTWEVMELPKEKKTVGCKWVFTTKYRSDGSLKRCKARLVAKGTADHTMLARHSTDGKIAILIVYVDDIILTRDDIAEMEQLKQCLASEFEIKDLGSLKFFLRMEIARSRKGIAVSQRKYVLDLLKETGMSGCRPVETPIDPNQKLGDNKGDPVNTSRYQFLVGKLIYLSHTRPDIAFAVSLVSQFMHSPREEHLEAVYCILRYLKSSPGKGLFFRKNEHRNLEAYTDADWAGSITDRKSTSGYCIFVWGNLVT
ncbi:hypothetical protein RJ639_037227 [Escallonia herrerae]|uniref:Retrovirus-related Pol polyprotein from transposon RE1 n=1 Tax=Escallonia herrerae TaxID=1293975 RepID=A0AA88WP55_9ASTE|nr:hypothetical protein RJ639_037227 [Escallonia herrerae]